MSSERGCAVVSPTPVPEELLAAFWRYDAALFDDDQDTLNDLYMPGPDTVRGDGSNFLVGHEAIAGFGSARPRIPTRRVEELHVRLLAEHSAVLLARTRDGDATGLQTQVWQRRSGRWRIIAAHVSLPVRPTHASAAAFDTTVWRVVGDPLVRATGTGPLSGTSIAVKDLIAVGGFAIGAGNPTWLAERAPEPQSAPVLATLLDAGAHIVGIARTDEFAYSLSGANAHYGSPPNPAAPDCLSGGSTSGPSSAVALGQAQVGLGTDTAGSIRVPASYQGLVGVRTTQGALSTHGVLPLAPSFDALGWVTRDVATSIAVAETLLGPRSVGPPATRTVRLPTVESLATSEVQRRFDAAVRELVLADRLPPTEAVDLPVEQLERWFEAFRTVQAWEAWQSYGPWLKDHPGTVGRDVARRFAIAAAITEAQADGGRAEVRRASAQLRAWLEQSLIVLPTAAGPAIARSASGADIESARASTLRLTFLASVSGVPAVSIPMLRSAEGRPVGMSLLSAAGTERDLLAAAGMVSEGGRPHDTPR